MASCHGGKKRVVIGIFQPHRAKSFTWLNASVSDGLIDTNEKQVHLSMASVKDH
jgi:hypothetical protein